MDDFKQVKGEKYYPDRDLEEWGSAVLVLNDSLKIEPYEDFKEFSELQCIC